MNVVRSSNPFGPWEDKHTMHPGARASVHTKGDQVSVCRSSAKQHIGPEWQPRSPSYWLALGLKVQTASETVLQKSTVPEAHLRTALECRQLRDHG